ncbi:hypothetical protein Rsub_07388 [Raphidocelis subcapitata]|uniref:Uncharacterized protein n=1 Tax=Raphidocelis subcapitata TaxID=307507 RepID=A0A2V0P6U9_9CHLO|nr:hypothetical protein Rsub_07388 [Raphidocelis subcapitata]|eukprot:GBF94652.1 hypothetical protein Rsub_07388 [Raphidocelis subcapitata]
MRAGVRRAAALAPGRRAPPRPAQVPRRQAPHPLRAAAGDAERAGAPRDAAAAAGPASGTGSSPGGDEASGKVQQPGSELLAPEQPAPALQQQPQPEQPRKRGALMAAFEALPPKTQITIVGTIFAVAMFILPFLQPTFMYGGETAPSAGAQQGVTVAEEQPAKPSRPIPIVTPALDWLQRFAMPRTLPDGRTESPGVIRIYLASMIILATFYACSAVLQLMLNGVALALKATGVIKGTPNSGDPLKQS